MNKSLRLKVMKRGLLLMAVLCAALPGRAQTDYVFYNATYGYLYNDNGTLKSGGLRFDKSSVWTASGTLQGDNNNLRYIQSYTSNQYLGRTGALSGTVSSIWRSWSNLLAFYRNYNTYYFKATSATTFESGTSANGYRYSFYTVTFDDIVEGLSGVEITGGASNFNTAGSATYSHSNATYCDQAYTHYNFNGNNYYVNSSNVSRTTNPATTITDASAYSWSLSDNATGYATVNASTGAVTVTAIPDQRTTITLTCTCTYNNLTTTASFNITLQITGVSSTTVTLDDREDHNWSYYQASSNLPAGYPTEYLSSPDPRNVKITYRGGSVNNASAVAISALDGEGQNTMIYYKTLEKSVPGRTGDYPYTVISNPFSKRPRTNGATGTSGFYGFAGWKVISGGEYISEYANADTLPLDETIHFTNLNTNYTPNCTSAEVVFEATWTSATVKTGSTAQTFTGGTYETNFWVLTGNPGSAVTVPGNSTMTARYPDGTVNFSGNFTRSITAGGDNAKVEWVNMNSTNAVNASNYTFTMGRGIVNSGNGGELNITTRDANSVNTVKIESGKYSQLRNFTTGLTAARTCNQLLILGCDYDRARSTENAYRNKLEITGIMEIGTGVQLNRTSGSLYVRTYIKSGLFMSGQGILDASADYCYYYSVGNEYNLGRRFLQVEGGTLNSIAGGIDGTNSENDLSFTYRMKGGTLKGSIYGAAAFAETHGIRQMIFTGGEVNGWIAGGANGVNTNQTLNANSGVLPTDTYIYIGGTTKVESTSNTDINSSPGGYIFGAGVGRQALVNAGNRGGNTGRVNTSYVAVSDECEIEHDVFAGGNFGFNNVGGNIFVTGGTVHGSVFGGANKNKGAYSKIIMTGGLVEGGIYGGSNETGTMSSYTTIQVDGGQVGTSSNNANIHGGGYGSSTVVTGNVDITLGASTSATDSVTVFGNVFGGSALGSVNGTSFDASKHTNITMNKALINGNLFGGALGQASPLIEAPVNGLITVTINGGTVNGNVYGGGDASPYSSSRNYPVVNMTGGKVTNLFGGGKGSTATVTGNPQVTLSGNAHVTGNVYGGGDAAQVSGQTNVILRD